MTTPALCWNKGGWLSMKHSIFAALFALFMLVSAPAFAEIDLTPYEVTDDALSRVMLIQPGLVLVHHDSGMSDGQFPTSIELIENGQTVFSKTFDDNAEWKLCSSFLMNANCYGYVLADRGDSTLGIQFVRLANGGPSPLLQLMDNRRRSILMDHGVCILNETSAPAIELLDWEGRLKLSYPLDREKRFTLPAATLLPNGTLRVVTIDRVVNTPESVTGTVADMMLRTFSSDGRLLSEAGIQSPYIGGFNDTIEFDANGGLIVCTAPFEDYTVEQITRFDAENRVLYQKTLSAPKTIVSVTDAFPSADGSVTLYGTAMANSRKLFTLYRLDLDAQGNITAVDIRDFTTRVGYLYNVRADAQGQIYAIACDYKKPIAVVPFEDLPAHDDPGLILE